MKKELAWIAAGVMLAGCGGGSDGNTTPPPPVAAQPAPVPVTPPPPPPPPPPAVSLVSASIARQAAADTGITMEVVVKPNFTPTGTLYASAADNAGVLAPTVAVSANSDGSYTLALSTVVGAPTGAHAGDATIKLCSDEACATPQAVPSIKVPYAITVSAAGSAWPGDKITPLAPWSDVADWSTFQGNAGHTGYVPVTLNPDQFALRWKIGSVNIRNASMAQQPYTLVASNGLFFTARDNKLQARKEADGSLVWTYEVSSLAYPSINPPAVDNGVVYMAAGQQQSSFLFGLDAVSGSVVLKSTLAAQWESFMAPVATGGVVYTQAGAYSGLYAVSASGSTLYKANTPQADLWSPAVDADSVYVFAGNSLLTYNRKTGVQQSRIDDLGTPSYSYSVGGAPVLGAKGTVFAAAYGNANWGSTNSLMKYNVEKGYIDWRVSGAYGVTPAYADGLVYALNKSPMRLEVRAETDGVVKWTWTPPIAGETLWAGEPVVTKNMVFVSTDKNTYAIDLRTRKPVWSYPLAGRLALTRSGILYIHSNEALVAVSVK